jgi:hypothetical protein
MRSLASFATRSFDPAWFAQQHEIFPVLVTIAFTPHQPIFTDYRDI